GFSVPGGRARRALAAHPQLAHVRRPRSGIGLGGGQRGLRLGRRRPGGRGPCARGAVSSVSLPPAWRRRRGGRGGSPGRSGVGGRWGGESGAGTGSWILGGGGLLAVALVAARGEFADLCKRWGRSLWVTVSTQRITYFASAPGTAAGGGLPFAVAIGIGASVQ